MKLTDEDRRAICAAIVKHTHDPTTATYEAIALHFLRAGMERAAQVCEQIATERAEDGRSGYNAIWDCRDAISKLGEE